ncbi:MAG TPA: sigma 54-interacting transcriptional regulator [Thermoanaerobaculia bacterium]|nr:sigma 54-interacting transcriptional regulator [Thermoanaerobaculia bacterium]HUM30116.1 sigma 54-interacting transcriptional regulator [Thermoanaerobaculia bacterium]HXK68813.1 sigma 54-interacting transcriptional regulator [Thermoanaerobaculia bacterium]
MNSPYERCQIYERILDHINEGVFVVDRDMRITYFNAAAERITGFSAAEAIGEYCYDILRSTYCPTACALKESLESGLHVGERELTIYSRDQREIPVSVSTSPLRDEDGNLIAGVETFRDLSLIHFLREEIQESHTHHDIITKNPTLLDMIGHLPDIAQSDLPVLIEGESGTGKELFAQAIHRLSIRQDKRLVRLNCAAIPDNLIESELFGYRKGAFTGAYQNKPGKFNLADAGTLFMDEIGELSPHVQAKLLRVLEDGCVEAIGALEPEQVNFRLISATHRSLSSMVESNLFRQDLYYRIGVIRIPLPPLRERREDIPLLIDHFIQILNAQLGKSVERLSPDACKLLMDYDFPGNIRQLRNILEHAFVLCHGKTIRSNHFPSEIRASGRKTSIPGGSNLREIERETLRMAMKRSGGNITRAAEDLGIHRTTLWRKLNKYGIK